MQIDANSVVEYLDRVPAERRSAIELVCERVKALVPDAVETIQHSMPNYSLDGEPFLAVASQKNYVSVYVVGLDVTIAGDDELARLFDGIGRGKSCLRLTKTKLDRLTDESIDALIKATLAWVAEHRG